MDTHTHREEAIESLARVGARQQKNECKEVSPDAELKGLLDTGRANGDRVWFYQTCMCVCVTARVFVPRALFCACATALVSVPRACLRVCC